MGKVLTLTVAALALAGCSVEAADRVAEARGAIEGGSVDVRDHAVVGVVVDVEGGPRRACTGSLIAPNLVLTAQHCVADTAARVDCARSIFAPPVSADRVRVTTGPALWARDASWQGSAAILVPPGSRSVCGHDVALIELSGPLDVDPLPLRLDDEVRADEGYAAIGYGAADGDGEGGGVRRRRDQLRVVCVGEGCGTRQVDGGEWRGDHGICSGDSGGPALDAEGEVIGVTSRGPAGCERPIYGALAAHADWLRGEARAAVRRGGVASPMWVDHMTRGPAAASTGCASAGAPNGAAGWPFVLIALAAIGRRRLSSRR